MSLFNLKRSFTSNNLDAEVSLSKKTKMTTTVEPIVINLVSDDDGDDENKNKISEKVRLPIRSFNPKLQERINKDDEDDEQENVLLSTITTSPALKKSVNELLMKARQKTPPAPKHSWLDTKTWFKNKKGNYTKKLGSHNVTFYQNKDQEWKFVYQGEHSTSYVYFESALNASYSKLKSEILEHFPV